MHTLKRVLAGTAIVFLVSASASAEKKDSRPAFENRLLDEVVEMSRAELPDATILAYLRARSARLETDVSAEDLIRLHNAGVSARVVEYIAGVTGIDENPSDPRADRDREVSESDDEDDSAAEESRAEDGDVEAYPEPYGSVYDPWPGWYGPYWDPYGWGGPGGVIVFRGGHRHHGGGSHGGHRGGRGSGH